MEGDKVVMRDPPVTPLGKILNSRFQCMYKGDRKELAIQIIESD